SLSYIEKKGKELNAVYSSNLERFVKDFQFSQNDIDKFISFAETKDVKFVENDFGIDKHYTETRLKAQIARNYWKNEGWYSVMLTVDNQVEKAITLFDEAKEIANLK
ncbi:MAG: S41 family peptidase, partial [Ignavibacteriaceae bacterium]|nr:S41 family peptidase [Ignavibacteriaceae bacterium]